MKTNTLILGNTYLIISYLVKDDILAIISGIISAIVYVIGILGLDEND